MRRVDRVCLPLSFPVSSASRRLCAVGLTGGAPRLVPSHGHAALIRDASGPLGLRAPLAQEAVECVWRGGLAVPFNVPRRSRRQGLRAQPFG